MDGKVAWSYACFKQISKGTKRHAWWWLKSDWACSLDLYDWYHSNDEWHLSVLGGCYTQLGSLIRRQTQKGIRCEDSTATGESSIQKLNAEKKILEEFKASSLCYYKFFIDSVCQVQNLEEKPVCWILMMWRDNSLHFRKHYVFGHCQIYKIQIKSASCSAYSRPDLFTKKIGQSAAPLEKDQLTAVLTTFAYGTKISLIIIGKSKLPRSFPRKFDPLKDLNAPYFA